MPDTVNLIIWLIAGVAGGFAVGDLLKGDFDLGPARSYAGVGADKHKPASALCSPSLRSSRSSSLIVQGDEKRRGRGYSQSSGMLDYCCVSLPSYRRPLPSPASATREAYARARSL
jgi:hypothetical protein